jgi:hypothetical protein
MGAYPAIFSIAGGKRRRLSSVKLILPSDNKRQMPSRASDSLNPCFCKTCMASSKEHSPRCFAM